MGTSSNKEESKNIADIKLFKAPFILTPIPVTLVFKIGGSIGFAVNYDIESKIFKISLTGEIVAKAELDSGVEKVLEITAGAKGRLIKIRAFSTLTKLGNSYAVNNHIINITGGAITCYVYGKLENMEEFNVSKNYITKWPSIVIR